VPFGTFRLHGAQKTGQGWAQTQSLTDTAAKLVAQARHLPEDIRQSIVADLRAYERDYWLDTGPLARLGLPQRVVLPLRDVQASVRRHAVHFVRGREQGR
jgi:hypothetical protein